MYIWQSSYTGKSFETSAPGGIDLRPKPEDQAFGDVADLKLTFQMTGDTRSILEVCMYVCLCMHIPVRNISMYACACMYVCVSEKYSHTCP